MSKNNTNKADKLPNKKEEALNFLLEEKERRALKKELNQQYDEILERKKIEKGSVVSLRRKLIPIISVAASICLIFFTYQYFVQLPDLPQLASKMYKETKFIVPSDFTTRGEANEKSNTELNTMIENKEYNQIVVYYEQKEKVSPLSKSESYIFAYSLSHGIKAEKKQAQSIFDEISKSNHPLEHDAQWFKCLLLVQNQQFTKAKIELELLKSKTNYKKSEVEQLIIELQQH